MMFPILIEHKAKYIYLLAYSASVYETPKKGSRPRQINRDDLRPTQQVIYRYIDAIDWNNLTHLKLKIIKS